MVVAALVFSIAVAPAQVQTQTQAQLAGLTVAQARHVTIEGKDGIEVTFDQVSAGRLLLFTRGAVGRHMIFYAGGSRLAAVRLLDPIENGNVLLTGDLNASVAKQLFAPGAIVGVELDGHRLD
jgi:hypothetical protein